MRFSFFGPAGILAACVAATSALAVDEPYPYPSCPAKETGGLSVANFEVVDPCECANDTATVRLDYDFYSNATRYDIIFGLGNGTDVIYDACLGDIATNAGSGNFLDLDGESDCGDILPNSLISERIEITTTCDANGDGQVDNQINLDIFMGWLASGGGRGYTDFLTDPKCSIASSSANNFIFGTSLLVQKNSSDPTGTKTGVGTFDFTRSGNAANPVCNAVGETEVSVTTVTPGVTEPAPRELSVLSYDQATQSYLEDLVITEVLSPDWDLTAATCSAPAVFDAAAGTVTIAAADIVPGAQIVCTFNNEEVAFTPDPSFVLAKTQVSGPAIVTGPVTLGYQIALTNDGNVALTGISVTDTLPDATVGVLSGPVEAGATDPGAATAGVLDVGETWTYSVSYAVTQADIDAGTTLVNTATATTDQTGATAQSDTAATPVSQNAGAVFDKGGETSFSGAGDTITYVFSVQNTGNVTVNSVVVTDTFFDPDYSCTVPSVAPGTTDTTTCTFTYTVTQADVDAGRIDNTANFAGTGADGSALSGPASHSAIGPAAAPALSVTVAEADGSGDFGAASSSETLTFTVTNTGNVTLTGLTFSDPLTGFSCTLPDLAPGETATQCADATPLSAVYTITQGDVDAAVISTTATATGTAPGGATVGDDATLSLPGPTQTPAITATKTVSGGAGFDTVGDVVSYDYVVTNSGNITLTGPISVSDDLIASVACPALPAGGLAPGASLTCTATYFVTQTDLDAGTVTNIASASLTQDVIPPGGGAAVPTAVTSADTTETAAASQTPALSLAKAVAGSSSSTFDAVGDTVTFTYTVTNTGNVTFTEDITIADDQIPGTLVCSTADLAPGASVTCSQDYVATQAALDAGSVTNIATAGSVFNAGAVTSPPGSVTISATQAPALSVAKTILSATPNLFDEGTVLAYEYVVTNTGNVTFTSAVTVSDNLTTVSCPGLPGGDLTPGESLTCSASYTITDDDLQLGSVVNVATAQSSFGVNTVTSPSDDAIFPVSGTPALTITKTTTPSPTSYATAGQTITYSYTVTNTGDVGLPNDVEVLDDRIAGAILCHDVSADGAFNIGEVATCSAVYTVTQPDVDAESVTNEALAETRFGAPPQTIQSPAVRLTVPVNPASTVGSLAVAKDVTAGDDPAGADDVLTYTITVTNDGPQTLSNVAASDPLLPALSCSLASPVTLAPGAALVCTGNYTVTQADMDAGSLTNTASATANDPQGDPVTGSASDAHPLEAGAPALTLTKSVGVVTDSDGSGTVNAGDVVTYGFTVANTGNLTLSNVALSDTGAAVSGGPIASLAPGASDSTTFSATRVITQADMDAGGIENSASVTGTAPGGGTINDVSDSGAGDEISETPDLAGNTDGDPTNDPSVTALAGVGELVLAKSVGTLTDGNGNGFADAGEVVTWSFSVTNAGTVTLSNVTISDGLASVAGGPIASLAPGVTDTTTFTASYTLTQADVDAGGIENSASATASLPGGGTVSDVSDSTAGGESVETPDLAGGTDGNPGNDPSVTVLTGASGLQLVKSVGTLADSNGNGFADPGEVLSWTFAVSNAGTVTLSNVTLSDALASVAGGPIANLAPGATDSTTFAASYVLTQTDIDAGGVENSATATASLPGGGMISDVSDSAAGDEATETGNLAGATDGDPTNDPSVTSLPVSRGLTLTKTAGAVVDANGSGRTDPGDTISYGFSVANTGTVTLSGVSLSDPGVTITGGPILSLAPGAVDNTTFTATRILSQADIDAGGVENSATVTGQPPTNPDGSTPPAVTDSSDAGDEGVETPDLAGGTDGDPTNDPTVTVIAGDPALSLVKSVGTVADTNGSGRTDPGDVVSYSFTVANRGTVSLSNVTVSDPGATVSGGPIANLAPGASDSTTYAATYVLTQADIDAGGVENSATVSGTAPGGAIISDVSDSAAGGETVESAGLDGATDGDPANDPSVTQLSPVSELTLTKTVGSVADSNGDGLVSAGDTVAWAFTVANTGNVTLSNVTVSDAVAVVSGGPIASLPPGATDSTTFGATYVLTQADLDAGALENSAVASGQPPTRPDGSVPAPVTDASDAGDEAVETAAADGSLDGNPTNDPTVLSLAEDASMEVLKTVTGSTGAAAGDTVSFAITVENTGNVTLSAPVLADSLRRLDGTVIALASGPDFAGGDGGTSGSLDVGETWSYTATALVTQADVDAGGISNQATANATTPAGVTVDDISDNGTGSGSTPTVFAITPAPELTALKTLAPAAGTVGETLVYTITLENTGNVTLSAVGIQSDTLLRADGTALTLASGPNFAGADAGSPEGTLAVGETASYTATYVLTQADVDAGGVSNQALVTGTPPVGGPVTDLTDDGSGSGDAPTELAITAAPGLAIVKSLASGGPTVSAPGDVLQYEFALTNTGNVTLTDPFVVSDPLITDAGGTITCPPPPLAPGDSMSCFGSYTVGQADIDAGQVDNVATARSGAVIAALPGQESVPALQAPALTLVKTAAPLAPADFIVGAVVDYTYTTTNTGNVTVTAPLSITDNLIPPGDVTCDPFPAGGLAPGDIYVCRASYTVTVDDVDLGQVTNIASATDGTTTSPAASETTPSGAVPALSVTKVITAGDNFSAVGDVVRYGYSVTNTGSAAFVNPVNIVDDRIAGPILCFDPAGPAGPDLIAGEVVTCSADYVVTQADLDAGEVINEAYAETTFRTGTPVVSAPVMATATASASPSLSLAKSASTLPVTAVGQSLTFTLSISNTGNQTVSNIDVSDPMLSGLSCPATVLAPGDSIDCTGAYIVTQADVDAGTLDNVATVSGLTPAGGTVSGTGSLSIAMPAAAPALSLSKTATPDPFGGVGTVVNYAFVVTNTGNVTLSGLSVSDPISPGYNCAVPDLAPGASHGLCTLSVSVTQDDIDAGGIANSASVSGGDPFGTPVSATDSIVTNAPAPAPALQVTKIANVTGVSPGSVVGYTVQVANTGNVTLTAPVLTDTMQRADSTPISLDAPLTLTSGDADTDGALDVGEIWVFAGQYTITQDDINAGGFSNSATAAATDPFGTPVADVSDDGNDSDGNTTDDVTEVIITPDPGVRLVKEITSADPVAGGTVVFRITAYNTGTVDLLNVTLDDKLSRADGTALAPTSGPTRVSSAQDDGDARLDVDEVLRWDVTYVLTQADIDAGGVENIARIEAESFPEFIPVGANSEDGDPGDGNPPIDPTVLAIPTAPGLEVTKTAQTSASRAGDRIEFEIAVANTGNITLRNAVLSDTMTNLDGTSLTPDSISYNGSDAEIAPGETDTFTLFYTVTQADIDSGGVANTAAVSATTPSGAILSDTSDDGDDSDGDTTGDTTIVVAAPMPAAVVTKTAATPVLLDADLLEVTFTIAVENTGNITLTGIEVLDDLTGFAGMATVLGGASGPDVTTSGFTAGGASGSYDGITDTNLLAAGTTLAPLQTGTITLVARLSTASGAIGGTNTASMTSDQTPAPNAATSSTSASLIAPAQISATKTATPDRVRTGETVTFTLSFTNTGTLGVGGLTLVDQMPPGLIYTPGTARFNGAATPAPIVSGSLLTWPGLTLGAGDTATVTLQARATGKPGDLTNRAWAQSAAGARLSNVATATVRVIPEAVFDCADVIGKVFHDRNQNGIQDLNPSMVANDDFRVGGKAAVADAGGETDLEEGIANARVVTPRGMIITTDAFGRFNVPCVELPGELGANVTLKLDPRSLPVGFRVVTENPRTLRMTAGKMARMNFGVALSRVFDIDLTGKAFDASSEAMSGPLRTALDGIVPELARAPSTLRLTYLDQGEGADRARARLDLVERHMRQAWGEDRTYILLIERVVVSVAEGQ